MAVLLLEAAVGGIVVLFASGVQGQVRRGFVLLHGLTVTMLAWGAWATTSAGIEVTAAAGSGDALATAATGPPGERLLFGLLVFAGLSTLWQGAVLAGRAAAARGIGLGACIAGVASLVLFALARGERVGLALLEVGLGALFLGSTTFGLLLGHWYLVERRLSNRWMIRSAWWYAAGVVAAVGAAGLSALNPARTTGGFSPFLAVPGFTLWLALGLSAVCALIAGFVWRLAREGGSSIQAATGMFYLAVIMAFSAELSAKFRFF